jgi:hypothetical protein
MKKISVQNKNKVNPLQVIQDLQPTLQYLIERLDDTPKLTNDWKTYEQNNSLISIFQNQMFYINEKLKRLKKI